jgi:hypothetical protein
LIAAERAALDWEAGLAHLSTPYRSRFRFAATRGLKPGSSNVPRRPVRFEVSA